MEAPERRRRRIDRVTAPDFLDGVQDASPAEVRALRDDCRAEESRLSYTRRILQGRLDIAKAEVRRRAGEGGGDLIDSLAAILSDETVPRAPTGLARSAPVYAPEIEGRRRADSMVDDATLGRLPDLSDDELADVVRRLRDEEHEVSAARKTVLVNLDALQGELVRRYREGGVDDLLSSAGTDPSGPQRPRE